MSYKNLILETEDRIGLIKMNRPEVRNVLNWETWMELEDALKRLHADPNLRAGIIAGVGDEAFLAGADLHMLKDRPPKMRSMPPQGPTGFSFSWSRWKDQSLPPSILQNNRCFKPPSNS